jgi:Cof subfamily protein (haloacid dehalogenase superfamily)
MQRHANRRLGAAVLAVVLAVALTSCAATRAVRFDAVYVDLDGTALGPDDRVRPATIEALRLFRACGGHVGIATGRSPRQVAHAVAALQPDLPLALYNGAVVASPDGHTLRRVARLAPGVRARAVAVAQGHAGVRLVAVHEPGLVLFDRQDEVVERFARQDDLPEWRVDPTLAWTLPDEPVKVLAVVQPPAGDALAAELRAAVGEQATVFVSSERTVEVIPHGLNKAVALRAILADAGLDPRDVVVFGDGDNDAEMVGEIGLGVAMGNARPRTRDAADVVIGGHDTDAMADFVRAVLLTPRCTP